jgi:hypothetical protein
MKYKRKTVFALIIFAFFTSIKAEEVVSLGDGRFATRESKLSLGFQFGEKVIINSAEGLSGRLSIIADSSEEAIFIYRKFIKTLDPSEAMDYADLIDISMEPKPGGLMIFFLSPNPAPWSGTENSARIEGELYLPNDCRLEIDARYFDLKVEGPFNSVKNRPSFGRIDVKKITEETNLTSSSQEIIAKDISGRISLTTKHGDIRADNLVADDSPAKITNENGGIFISNLAGGAHIKNSYGKIRLDNARFINMTSRISSSYGPIRIDIKEIDQGLVAVDNLNSEVDVRLPEKVSSRFRLSVSADGTIKAEGLPMKPSLVNKDRLEFAVGEGESEIIIDIKGEGDIYIKGTRSDKLQDNSGE